MPQGDARALLDDAVRQWPDGPAIDFMGRKLSYRQLSTLVDQAAAGFQKLGVQPGVHVGLYLPNTPQYVISFFGVLRAGGTVLNYWPLDAASVLTHKLEDSVTDVLVTLDLAALYANMRPLLGNSRLKWLVVNMLLSVRIGAEMVLCIRFEPGAWRDAALMDEDGFVFIVDRTQDMLLCGGFNVCPRVIEEAIYEHPQVEEVLVLGVDDDYLGQSLMAFVKVRAGAEPLTLDALKEFLKPRLGKHEMISAMELRSELPKTAVGKLSKAMLKDEMARAAGRNPNDGT